MVKRGYEVVVLGKRQGGGIVEGFSPFPLSIKAVSVVVVLLL